MSTGAEARVVAYVGLGANLGDAAGNVSRAIGLLGSLPLTRLRCHSSLYRSAPLHAAGDDYVNAVVQLETSLSAVDLLRELRALELQFGRERPYANAPRTMDLDILLYGAQIMADPMLIVPHPRLTQRAFALIPLLEIDPVIMIPGLGPAHGFLLAVAEQTIEKLDSVIFQ